jgi:membrane dipeptidase
MNPNASRWLRVAGTVLLVVAAGIAGWKLAGRGTSRARETSLPTAPELVVEDLLSGQLVVDTHIDLPTLLFQKGAHAEDVGQRTRGGQFDAVRARLGRLNVAWMSIYVPAEYQKGDGGKTFADGLIDLVDGLQKKHPTLFAIPASADEAEKIARDGRIALPLGMENGAGIEDDLGNLRHFYERGVRYITLTHSEDNRIADSSFSDPAERHWHGLSPFGRRVITEMNRLGILVDLSHVSDEAFDQALAASKAPPIASHSSCRYFTPGFERNVDDARLRALAAKGGVLQINFGSAFLTPPANAWFVGFRREEMAFVARTNAKEGTAELDEFRADYLRRNHFPRASIDDVVAHIDHAVQVAGIDHVGLGSDFDGVEDTLPVGLEDVSKYPLLAAKLAARGYDREQIGKIFGGNFMRVWRQAEQVARASGGARPDEAPAYSPDLAARAPANGG